MRVTLVMLTYNRADIVARSMAHNVAHAGVPIDELVWVDNGSTDHVRDVMLTYKPDVCVLNKCNLGVSKGYNRGFAVATGDYIAITDDDMLMPSGWLATFKTYLTTIANTGVACIFHDNPNVLLRNRQFSNGLEYLPCYPIGRRIVSRELLAKRIGYLREDFGLFGLEDIEWGRRAVRVCREDGLLTYAIPGQRAIHLGTEVVDGSEYRAFKRRENHDPRKAFVMATCHADNYPYYNPYA
jgi:GT2 family glycosyltransferase